MITKFGLKRKVCKMSEIEDIGISQTLIETLDMLPNGVCVWTEDDHLIFANQIFRDIQKQNTGTVVSKGMRREELVRKAVSSGFVILADGITIEQRLAQIKENRFSEEALGGTELHTKGGGVYLMNTRPLKGGNYLQIYTDITEIKQHEVVLEEKERRFSLVSQALNAFVFEWDIEKNVTTFSIPDGVGPGEEKVFNTRHFEELDTIYEQDRPAYKKALIGHFKKDTPLFVCEHRGVSDEGEVNWYRTRGKAVWNDQGRAIKLYAFVENIDEQKQLKERANALEQRAYDVLNNISAGVMVWDKEDRLVLVNNYFDKWEAGLEIGQPYESEVRKLIAVGMISKEDGQDLENFVETRLKQRKQLTGTAVNQMPMFSDGSYLQLTSKRMEHGGMVQVFTDVTDLTTREQELESLVEELNVAKQLADTANQTKSQFLANMSHELRTPLNAIIGLTEMLKEDCLEDGLDDFVEPLDRVFSAGKHLLTLINDVLDLSKIEAGRIELYNETFELEQLLEDVLRTTQPLLATNNNTISLNFIDHFSEITNDQTRIKQIFLNLISNATKFTENGEIKLNVRKTTDGNCDLFAIDVIDTGIGMTKEQVSRLFTAFVQADSSTTRKYGGTGLGLTISKQLAQLMGGDITVTSTLGMGTTFTATLALNNADVTGSDTVPREPLITRVISTEEQNGKTVLIIDDDPTVSSLMQRHLIKNGYNVLAADSGKTGLKMAREKQPDVITLDILMPEIDGWSTLRALKADKKTKNIPVIMASILDEKNKGFSLGAADFLSKPVEKEYLIGSVQRLLGDKVDSTILLVEDDVNLRLTVKEILERVGLDVIEAENGANALEILAAKSPAPDLILLDLLMPVMNGFEFLQRLRETDYATVPVLVLTGADLSEEQQEFLSLETLRVIEKSEANVAKIAQDIEKAILTLSGVSSP